MVDKELIINHIHSSSSSQTQKPTQPNQPNSIQPPFETHKDPEDVLLLLNHPLLLGIVRLPGLVHLILLLWLALPRRWTLLNLLLQAQLYRPPHPLVHSKRSAASVLPPTPTTPTKKSSSKKEIKSLEAKRERRKVSVSSVDDLVKMENDFWAGAGKEMGF